MAGESFQDLLELGRKREKGRSEISSVGLNKDISEAQALNKNKSRQKANAYEHQVTMRNAADETHDDKLVAEYGTADPKEAAQAKASGVYDTPDQLMKRMQIDPEGTRAAIERETQRWQGQRSLPEDAGPPREYSEGVGAHGERYFTNLTRGELHAQSHERGDTEPPVTDLHSMGMRDTGAPADARTPSEILFEGKLERAQQIAGIPERQDKHARTVESISSDLQDFEKYPTANEALDALHAKRQSGELGQSGVSLKEEAAMEKAIAHFARPVADFTDKELDRTVYRPWTQGGDKPGQAADKAAPADILNPGGAMPLEARTEAMHSAAVADHASALTEQTPRELPRTYQYANGASPQPRQTPGVPTPQSAARPGGMPRVNPIDSFMESIAPPVQTSPSSALRRKRRDTGFGSIDNALDLEE